MARSRSSSTGAATGAGEVTKQTPSVAPIASVAATLPPDLEGGLSAQDPSPSQTHATVPAHAPHPKPVVGEEFKAKIVKQTSNADNTYRRKWNREEYLERALEAEKEEEDERDGRKARGPPVQRKPLKHRDYEVDLTSRLGKTQVVTQVAPLSQQAGYFCPVCECVVKDSANYLDHINGKKHQRALGMSMRVERATLQQVQDRFGTMKRKKEAPGFNEQDLDLRILKQQQEEEERKKQRKEKRREKKREKPTGEEVVDEFDMDMAATMGFGGFGTTKK